MDTLLLVVFDVMLVFVVARGIGVVLGRLGQPAVMAEVLAGLVLGTSLLAVSTFDGEARQVLVVLGEIAVARYLFCAGTRLDAGALRGSAVVRVAGASFLVPLAAGAALALALHRSVETDPPLGAFALFMGTALAVTALPVLARIVDAHGLRERPEGRLALASAAVQELLVWPALVLAVLLVGAGGPPAVVFVVAGSFAAGLLTPRRPRACVLRALDARPVALASALLLPLFFALPAMRVDLAAIDAGGLLALVAVLAVAVPAKLASATAAARSAGLDRTQAARVGALMNARGLVELVVLSVGLAAGLIDQRLYAVMVLMALVTTFATGPLLHRIGRREPSGRAGAPKAGSPLEVSRSPGPPAGTGRGPAKAPAGW